MLFQLHVFVPMLCLLCCDVCHIDLFLLKFACVHASAYPSPSKSMLRAPCRVLRLLPKDYQIRLCRIRHFLWSYRIGTFASRSWSLEVFHDTEHVCTHMCIFFLAQLTWFSYFISRITTSDSAAYLCRFKLNHTMCRVQCTNTIFHWRICTDDCECFGWMKSIHLNVSNLFHNGDQAFSNMFASFQMFLTFSSKFFQSLLALAKFAVVSSWWWMIVKRFVSRVSCLFCRIINSIILFNIKTCIFV